VARGAPPGRWSGRSLFDVLAPDEKDGAPIPDGFDFSLSVILLPKKSVLFAIPRTILNNGQAIRFGFTFQKVTDENKIEDTLGSGESLRSALYVFLIVFWEL
jgi:hypothetical protein